MGAAPPLKQPPRQQALPRRPRWPVWLGLGLLTLLTCYALGLAITRWDAPTPGLLTDPSGALTNFGWPWSSGHRQGLAFPARVVRVDGIPLPPPRLLPTYPAELLDQAARRTEAGGELLLEVLSPGEDIPRAARVRVERMGGLPWLFLFGGCTLLAWIWVLAAGFSYVVRPDAGHVAAFCRWALLNALLLLCLFDYHTTRRLVLLFLLLYSVMPAVIIELALRFPDDIEPLRRWPALVWLPRATGVALLSANLGFWLTGRDYNLLGGVASGLSLLLLALVMVGRCLLAEGRRRTQLLLGLSLCAPICAAVGAVFLLAPQRAGVHVLLYSVPLCGVGTLGLTYALLRYDLWDSGVLLHRRALGPMLTIVLALLTGFAATALVLSLAETPTSWQALLVFCAAAAFVPLHRVVEDRLNRTLFPADVIYRPTVEQLTLRLSDLASRQAVVDAVESTVKRWLPCDRVRFLPVPVPRERPDDSGEMQRSLPPVAAMAALALTRGEGISISSVFNPASLSLVSTTASGAQLEPPEWRLLRRAARAGGIEGIDVQMAAALHRGEVVHPRWRGDAGWAMVLPARFRDQVVALLAVSAQRHGKLLTSEDETLLRTVASQAALALACANATEEVESLRRAQQAALREEKEAALSAFAAEIAHEIRIPINYFKLLLDSYGGWVRDGLPPESEQVDIGREEIDRLERMAGNLRRIAAPKGLNRQSVELRTLVEHVRLLLRDRLAGRLLEIEVAPLLDVDGDRDAMTQILVNLITNALDACPRPGRVGLLCEVLSDGRLRLTVWDTGQGLPADVGKLFQPLFTTKKTGTGLGLPITRRLVRAHGWEIGAQRREERTCFDVIVPMDEWRTRPPVDEGHFESNPLK